MAGKVNTPSGKIGFYFDEKNKKIVIFGNQEIEVNGNVFNSNDFNRELPLTKPGTFHLRFSASRSPINSFVPPNEGFYLVDVDDASYNPTGEVGDEESDLLLAEIVYDGNKVKVRSEDKSEASRVISLLEEKQRDIETKLGVSKLKIKEVDGFHVGPGEFGKLFNKNEYSKFMSVQVFKKVPSTEITRTLAGKVLVVKTKKIEGGPVSFPVYLEDDGNTYRFFDLDDGSELPVYSEDGKLWIEIKNVSGEQEKFIECRPSDIRTEAFPEQIFSFFSDCTSLTGVKPYGSIGIVLDESKFGRPVFKKVNPHPNGAYFESKSLPNDNFIAEFEFFKDKSNLVWFELENYHKDVISAGINFGAEKLIIGINGHERKFSFPHIPVAEAWFKFKIKVAGETVSVSLISEDGIEIVKRSIRTKAIKKDLPFKLIRIMGDGDYYLRKIRVRKNYGIAVEEDNLDPVFDTSLWYGILSLKVFEHPFSDNRYVFYVDGTPYYWDGNSWTKSLLVFSQTNSSKEINSISREGWESFPLGNELRIKKIFGKFPFSCTIEKIGDYYLLLVPHIEDEKAVYYKNTESEMVNLVCRIFYWEE